MLEVSGPRIAVHSLERLINTGLAVHRCHESPNHMLPTCAFFKVCMLTIVNMSPTSTYVVVDKLPSISYG